MKKCDCGTQAVSIIREEWKSQENPDEPIMVSESYVCKAHERNIAMIPRLDNSYRITHDLVSVSTRVISKIEQDSTVQTFLTRDHELVSVGDTVDAPGNKPECTFLGGAREDLC